MNKLDRTRHSLDRNVPSLIDKKEKKGGEGGDATHPDEKLRRRVKSLISPVAGEERKKEKEKGKAKGPPRCP